MLDVLDMCCVTYIDDSIPSASDQQIAEDINEMRQNNMIRIIKECIVDATLEPYKTVDDQIYVNCWIVGFYPPTEYSARAPPTTLDYPLWTPFPPACGCGAGLVQPNVLVVASYFMAWSRSS